MDNELYFSVWLAVISMISAVVTLYDKAASKSRKWRVPEKILMLLGFVGGATAMYVVMQLIRHKTKHKKFMIGLPVFIVIHLALTVYIVMF